MMYIFIYRLKSEDFKYDHYIEAGGCSPSLGSIHMLIHNNQK